MPNPNNITDIIDVVVNLLDGVASTAGFSSPLFVSQFATSASFTGRYKEYTGTAEQIDDALAADGFAAGGSVRGMIAAATAQDGPPRTIYLGRWDAGDADLEAGLDAIWDALALDNEDGYAVHVDPTIATDADHVSGFNWVLDKFAIYFAQTDTAAIKTNTPGNLALTGLALDSTRISVLWHDAATASLLGPAQLQSALETYNIANGGTLQLRIDGGATQAFAFAATAAIETGSNAATFAIASGDTLSLTVDGGATQTVTWTAAAATITSGNAETYNFVDGDTLNVRVDGAAAQTVTFNGAAGTVDTGAEPYAFLAPDTITFSIDGGANQVLTPGVAATTAALLKAQIDAQITGVTTTIIAGPAVRITSNRLGTDSDVEIVAGSANALTESGLSVGNNNGTGFAAFLDVATAAEVAAEINADTTGCTASGSTGSVSITSDVIGTDSRIQVSGGTANTLLAFNTTEQAGSGDYGDSTAVTLTETLNKINSSTYGLVASASGSNVRLTSNTLGTGSQIVIVGGTVATTLGVSGTTNGTGDFVNAALATANEVVAVISATLTGGSVAAVSSRVVVSSATSGSSSSVEAVGGTSLTALGFSGIALGTGVTEDFALAAWIGRCITFALDQPNGAALWDNQSLRGIYADKLTATERNVLHNTLRVNTYENRNGRNETHFGYLLNSTQRYIDERTSADWLDARITEAFKQALNNAADQKSKIPITNEGIQRFANLLLGVLRRSEVNGHTVFDSSTLDPSTPNDTGVFIPDVSSLTDADIAARNLTGFLAVQRLQGGVQKAAVRLDLTRVLAG